MTRTRRSTPSPPSSPAVPARSCRLSRALGDHRSRAASGCSPPMRAAAAWATTSPTSASSSTRSAIRCPRSWPATAGEIRLIGVPPTAEAAIAKAWAAVERANGIPVTAWALANLVALAKDLDGLGTLARGLREAGVAGVADVRLDLVEDPAVQWVVDAGLGVPVVGVHDAPANPVVFLRRVASLQKATRAFRAVAPLPRRVSTEAPSTGYDDVKLIALAALLVDGVGRVQVDCRRPARRQAQSGGAPVRRQRPQSRGGNRRRAARTAPRAGRGSAPQHPRRVAHAGGADRTLRHGRRGGRGAGRERRERGVADTVMAGIPDRPPRRGQLSQHAAAGRGPRGAAGRRAALRRAGALRQSRRGRRGRPRAGANHRVRAPRRRLRGGAGRVDRVARRGQFGGAVHAPADRARPVNRARRQLAHLGRPGPAAVRAALPHPPGVRAGGAGHPRDARIGRRRAADRRSRAVPRSRVGGRQRSTSAWPGGR